MLTYFTPLPSKCFKISLYKAAKHVYQIRFIISSIGSTQKPKTSLQKTPT